MLHVGNIYLHFPLNVAIFSTNVPGKTAVAVNSINFTPKTSNPVASKNGTFLGFQVGKYSIYGASEI